VEYGQSAAVDIAFRAYVTTIHMVHFQVSDQQAGLVGKRVRSAGWVMEAMSFRDVLFSLQWVVATAIE
jgi:hypothetical protein